jgi:hypothetical protein
LEAKIAELHEQLQAQREAAAGESEEAASHGAELARALVDRDEVAAKVERVEAELAEMAAERDEAASKLQEQITLVEVLLPLFRQSIHFKGGRGQLDWRCCCLKHVTSVPLLMLVGCGYCRSYARSWQVMH